MPTNVNFAVLHAIRLKGIAKDDAISAHVDADKATMTACLEDLASRGLTKYREGRRVSGWALTDSGREQHAMLLDDAMGSDDVAGLAVPYNKFLTVNSDFKTLCVRWMEANYSQTDLSGLLRELAETHETVTSILLDAERAVPDLRVHRQRFEVAGREVAAGNHDFVTSPRVDSYHTVWFEMHEDMILRLKISRADEGSF